MINDVQVRMRILNLGKATTVPKLNEEKAIETGSQLLSEFILLSIGASLLVLEFLRQSEKEEAKQEKIEKEKADLNERIGNLEFSLEQQRTELRELKRLSHAIEDKLSKKWGSSIKMSEPSNVEYQPSSSRGVISAALTDILGHERTEQRRPS